MKNVKVLLFAHLFVFPRKNEANSALAHGKLLNLLWPMENYFWTKEEGPPPPPLGVKRWHSLVGLLVKKGSKFVTWAPIGTQSVMTHIIHKCQNMIKYRTLRILH
jgi:hypothetical protein